MYCLVEYTGSCKSLPSVLLYYLGVLFVYEFGEFICGVASEEKLSQNYSLLEAHYWLLTYCILLVRGGPVLQLVPQDCGYSGIDTTREIK